MSGIIKVRKYCHVKGCEEEATYIWCSDKVASVEVCEAHYFKLNNLKILEDCLVDMKPIGAIH